MGRRMGQRPRARCDRQHEIGDCGILILGRTWTVPGNRRGKTARFEVPRCKSTRLGSHFAVRLVSGTTPGQHDAISPQKLAAVLQREQKMMSSLFAETVLGISLVTSLGTSLGTCARVARWIGVLAGSV